MPALFVFLLKVNVALLIFCAGYYFVLRHLTFYTLNRIYLIAAILFASVYPQINLSGFAERHQELAKPVQIVVLNLQAPAETFIKPLSQPTYWYWAEFAFWTVATLLALRLIMQLFALYRLYKNSTAAKIFDHDVRVMDGNSGPFSFWKSIYVNPTKHEPADLKSILLHEQVHVSEWHTLDILLAELSTIFYWFNPGVWLMKKAIRENIEFITDRKILNNGVDTKQYQYSLVNVSFNGSAHGIVNHFNISTIKKRIIMMNAKRSSKFNLTRYAFLVPAIVALLLVFSISKAALIKKSATAYKALAITVNRIGNTIKANDADKPSVAHVSTKTEPANVATKSTKAEIAKVTDTIKKEKLFISQSDSLNYVINGVKATKAEFGKIDPDHIYAIEILPAEQAKKVIDQLNNKHNVLFVTTNDSDAGKKFKEKLDKLNNNRYTILTKSTNGGAVNISSGDGWSSSGGDSLITINGKNSSSGGVFVTGSPKLYKYSVSGDKVMVDSMGHKKLIYSTNGDPALVKLSYTSRPSKVYTSKVYTTNGTGFKTSTNIDHFSEKLIIIDGKEATQGDLKKLSAADIEGMTVKSGDEMTKQYGDKAKNGVLYITTKKAGK